MVFKLQIFLLGSVFLFAISIYASNFNPPHIPGIIYADSTLHFGPDQFVQLAEIGRVMGWSRVGTKEKTKIQEILDLNNWTYLRPEIELEVLQSRWSPLRAAWMAAHRRAVIRIDIIPENNRGETSRSKRPKAT